MNTSPSTDKHFDLIPVHHLLGERYTFNVPSFQRGYRWGKQEVEDLLCDLAEFADQQTGADASGRQPAQTYLLQPLVVRKAGDTQYDVLDGQQRLTTLRILLQWLKENIATEDPSSGTSLFFTITYSYRNQHSPIDFENLNELKNLSHKLNWATSPDHFFVYKAYECLNQSVLAHPPLTDRERQVHAILQNKYTAYTVLREIRGILSKEGKPLPIQAVNQIYEYLLKGQNDAGEFKIYDTLLNAASLKIVNQNKKYLSAGKGKRFPKRTDRTIRQKILPFLQTKDISGIYNTLLDDKNRRIAKEIHKIIQKNTSAPNKGILHQIYNLLLGKDANGKQVKFIWYDCTDEVKASSEPADNDAENSRPAGEFPSKDLEAIRFFNQFNEGKIPLTASDLIKALFIMNTKREGGADTLVQTRTNLIILQWDQLEKQFQDPAFIAFAFPPKSAATDESPNKLEISLDVNSLDDFFNFAVLKTPTPQDSLPAYRYFQEKFDNSFPQEFTHLWQDTVLKSFDVLVRWYQDPVCYNYVGWLVFCGKSLLDIRAALKQASTQQNAIAQLRQLIKNELPREPALKEKYNAEYTDYWDAVLKEANYAENPWLLRKVLLLFNIAIYIKPTDLDEEAVQKFPFAAYYKDKWDLEHIASQKDNDLREAAKQKEWVRHTITALEMENQPITISPTPTDAETPNGPINPPRKSAPGEQTPDLLTDLKQFRDHSAGKFSELYQRVVEFYDKKYEFSEDAEKNEMQKHDISNMVLLDKTTNRGYHNDPFPYKLKCIIERDSAGQLILAGTKNAFLHYYNFLSEETPNGPKNAEPFQLPNLLLWAAQDRKKYRAGIKNTLQKLFKKEKE